MQSARANRTRQPPTQMTKTQLRRMAAHLKLLLLEGGVKIITVTAATEQVAAVLKQR
jgi:hypothetical protein